MAYRSSASILSWSAESVRRDVIALILFCFALFLPGIASVPPIDRDEARFAQATRQMIETLNWLDIRFQEEPRYKKPPGIHWLQAGVVRGLELVSGREDLRDSIWPYRLPSLAGALVSVLALYGFVRRIMMNGRIAFLSAMLLASSLLLVVESHLATTDAMLLAAVVVAMGALMRAWTHREEGEEDARTRPRWSTAIAFWMALAFGMLLKGPVALLAPSLTIITIATLHRSSSIWRAVRPLPGLSIFIVLTLAWAVPLYRATDGAFFRDAIFGDLLPKVASGVESHGFAPGFYLVLVVVTFWPGSLIAGPAVFDAWRRARRGEKSDADHRVRDRGRSRHAIIYLLAWLLPTWLVLEIVPTKLPHYVLPIYPALAIVCASFIEQRSGGSNGDNARARPGIGLRLGFVFWGFLTLVFGFGLVWFARIVGEGFEWWRLVLPLVGFAILTVWPAWCAIDGRYRRALMTAAIVGALVYASVLQFALPRFDRLWLSRSVADAIEERRAAEADAPLISAGYHEPSLVFLCGADTQLVSGRRAAELAMEQPDAVVLIADQARDRFREALVQHGLRAEIVETIRGFNYSKGEWVTIEIVMNVVREIRHAAAAPTETRVTMASHDERTCATP